MVNWQKLVTCRLAAYAFGKYFHNDANGVDPREEYYGQFLFVSELLRNIEIIILLFLLMRLHSSLRSFVGRNIYYTRSINKPLIILQANF